MVAEVIKLPSSTPNNFKPIKVGSVGVVVNTLAQGVQNNVSNQADRFAEQAAKSIETIAKAVNELNNFAKQIDTNLNFSVDETSGRSVITVTDSQTGEVIRQIPAKEILAVANLLREFATSDVEKVGLLFADQG